MEDLADMHVNWIINEIEFIKYLFVILILKVVEKTTMFISNVLLHTTSIILLGEKVSKI